MLLIVMGAATKFFQYLSFPYASFLQFIRSLFV